MIFKDILLGTILASTCNAAYVQFQTCHHVEQTNSTAPEVVVSMIPESLGASIRPTRNNADLNLTITGGYFASDNCDDSIVQSISAEITVTNVGGKQRYPGRIMNASCINRHTFYPLWKFEIGSTLDQLSSLDTIHTRLDLRMPNGTSFSCVTATLTPQIGYWAQLCGLLTPIVILCLALVMAFISLQKERQEINQQLASTQRQCRHSVTRIADLLAYIQFIFFSGALNLQYPGFLQPVISLCGWSMLMLPSGPVITHSIYSGTKDGIYETNGTITGAPGLELITQMTASPPKAETWINTLSLSLLLFILFSVFVIISGHALSDHSKPSAAGNGKSQFALHGFLQQTKDRLWNVMRLFFSYFLLPLTTWSTYLLVDAMIHPRTSIVATIVLALLTLGLWWFLSRAGGRDIGYFIVPTVEKANLRTRLYHMRSWPVWVLLGLSVSRAFIIGGLQAHSRAQFAILVGCEGLQFLFFTCWASVFSSSWFPGIISGLRLVIMSLHAGFLSGITTHTSKMLFGYIVLSLHIFTLVFIFLVPITWELVSLILEQLPVTNYQYSSKPSSITSSTRDLDGSQHQEVVRLISYLEHHIIEEQCDSIGLEKLFSFIQQVQGEDQEIQSSPLLASLGLSASNSVAIQNGNVEEGFSISISTLVDSLLSPSNIGVVQEPKTYELDAPINEYYISSSHNTYLLGRQVVARSDLHGYISALADGCRCIEIDCWDGRHGQPIVKHGYALTASVRFEDVIKVIHKHAFDKSEFPLWISLEVHCSESQQQIMVQIMKKIFGRSLVTEPLDKVSNRLPSPSQLRRRVLIKTKIYQDAVASSYESKENEINSNSTQALADLAVYGPGKKFKTAEWTVTERGYIYSLSESNFKQQTRVQTDENSLDTLNKQHIMRVYPNPTRVDSSNFNPLQCWRYGAQMVAMNYQTKDNNMLLHRAMFSHGTDASGYVLKPDVLRQDPNTTSIKERSITFSVTVIMTRGLSWAYKYTKTINELSSVEFEILLTDGESSKQATRTDDVSRGSIRTPKKTTLTDAQDVFFGQNLTSSIKTRFPSLAFVRWSIGKSSNGHRSRTTEAVLSQIAKLDNLKTGYRLLPLSNSDNEPSGHLFCKIEKSITS